jgi:formylglycine-generating enzyme required for sulfatase activity
LQVEAESAELKAGKILRDCPQCPEMVVIPAGSFDMGSNSGETNEKPRHRVTISYAFAMGKTEVTQGQWRALMGDNPLLSQINELKKPV